MSSALKYMDMAKAGSGPKSFISYEASVGSNWGGGSGANAMDEGRTVSVDKAVDRGTLLAAGPGSFALGMTKPALVMNCRSCSTLG